MQVGLFDLVRANMVGFHPWSIIVGLWAEFDCGRIKVQKSKFLIQKTSDFILHCYSCQ